MPPRAKSTSTNRPVNPQDPSTYIKPDEPLIGADGRDWSWAYVWYKDVDGFPGYKVGSNGSIWSSIRMASEKRDAEFQWRERAQQPNAKGYMHAGLRSESRKIKTIRIHICVLETFVGPRPVGLEACHWNGNRADNRLGNLRWDTAEANWKDRYRHGTDTSGSRCGTAKLTDETVEIIRDERRRGVSAVALAERFGVTKHAVYRAAAGKTYRAKVKVSA